MRYVNTRVENIMCRTNVGVPLIGRVTESRDHLPEEFFYISSKFGGYFATEHKHEALAFDTEEEVQAAIAQINKVYDETYRCWLYRPNFDEYTQRFDESLDVLTKI